MAIGTYEELQSAISNWLAKSYPTARVQEFIALAEAHIRRELYIRAVEATADLALTASATSVSLPTGFHGIRRIYIDGNIKRSIDYFAPPDFWRRYGSGETGKPKIFTVEGDLIEFGPAPDADYTGKILYWQRLTPLSDAATTNDVLTDHPDLYLHASLVEAHEFKGDSPEQTSREAKRDRIITSIRREDNRDRFGPAPLQIRADVNNP